jgi:hypothetical protein
MSDILVMSKFSGLEDLQLIPSDEVIMLPRLVTLPSLITFLHIPTATNLLPPKVIL